MKQDHPYTEKELLLQIAEGDEQAFNIILSQYRDRLFQFLIRIVKSQDIADEIITDVFMKLWLGKSLLAHIENLEGFLHKVGYNKAMNFFKVVSRHSPAAGIPEQVANGPGKECGGFADCREDHLVHVSLHRTRQKFFSLSFFLFVFLL